MSHQVSFIKSLGHAADGIKAAFKDEPNFRVHTVAGSTAIIAGALLHFSPEKMAILVLTCLFVISFELLNTMIEEIVNIIRPEYSIKAKLIKDVSAACVLILAFAAVLVGLLLFGPYILQLLSAVNS